MGNQLEADRFTEDGRQFRVQNTYNEFNQLVETKKKTPSQSEYYNYLSYEYDGRGNQTVENHYWDDYDSVGYYRHSYDLMNRLTKTVVENKSGYAYAEVTNSYNAAGQRISKTELDTTRYYYSGSEVLYTTTDRGTSLSENLLAADGELIATRWFRNEGDPANPNSGRYYFFNKDIRGSTTAAVRPWDGSYVEKYYYDAFGSIERSNTAFANEVTFTGSITDQSTGLHYMNARFYNPRTTRFLTQDTYSGNPYDPWTQHLYSYCGNNPTSMVDPTGIFST